MIDYSQFGLMDSLAMLAVGVFVYNIIMIVVILVQLHGLLARKGAYTFNVKSNTYMASISAMIIYFHLFVLIPIS